jgi:hypothetical protein
MQGRLMVEKRSHFQRTSCFGHLLSTSKKTAQHIRTNRCSWNFLLCFARASPNCCTLPKVVCIKKQPKFNGYNNLLVITCTFSMKIALWRVLATHPSLCSPHFISVFPKRLPFGHAITTRLEVGQTIDLKSCMGTLLIQDLRRVHEIPP